MHNTIFTGKNIHFKVRYKIIHFHFFRYTLIKIYINIQTLMKIRIEFLVSL